LNVRNLEAVSSRNDVRGEIRQFLTTRRAKITPEQAGLPRYGGRRRVAGLRREEVALLAGISIEYYTRLERGDARGRSTSPGSSSSTAGPASSTATGTASPMPLSAACAPKPAATPYDRALTDLVGELSTRSHEFRVRWAAHDVKYYRSGVQPFHHPIVGDLTLNYDALEIPADPGLTIIAYTAEADSPAQQALDQLATWASTRAHRRSFAPRA
jgi:MmyB-like transcription regulator ligand binding domain